MTNCYNCNHCEVCRWIDKFKDKGVCDFYEGDAPLTKALEQEPTIGHWIYDRTVENWRCTECDKTPKIRGYVGTLEFMVEHFKYCPNCGARMRGE